MKKNFLTALVLSLLASCAIFAADSGGVTEGEQSWNGRKIFLKEAITDSTLTGAGTLDRNSNVVQRIDPGGASRDVTIDAGCNRAGFKFKIINSADAAETLTIKNSAGTTIVAIAQNEAGEVFYSGDVTWYGYAYSNAAGGHLVAAGSVTGATSQTQIFTNGVTADTFVGNSANPMTVTAKAGSSAVGNALTMAGGAGNGAFDGGAASLTGGASGAGATGAGGAATIAGGVASSTNGAGGAVAVTGGAGVGTGAGGANTQVGGAGGATGAGGAWLATAGRGGATSGAAGTASLIAGAGGASATVTGGVALLKGGASGGGATGDGGDVQLTGGAAASTNGNGGSNILTPGAKAGTGIAGGNFIRSATGLNFFQQTAAGAGADQAETLTAATMINGIFVHTISTGRTLTTPTGANITAGCPASVATGDAFKFTLITVGSGADDIVTLTAGDGNVTFVGDVTVGPVSTTTRSSGTWIFRKTGASTWVGYREN